MTGPEMTECRRAIGWTKVELAARIGRSEATVRYMESGRLSISPAVATWLRTLAELHRRVPGPAVDPGRSK